MRRPDDNDRDLEPLDSYPLPPHRQGRSGRLRLPPLLRRALLWLVWAFGVLALVDMALSIWHPGRPLVVATALLETLVRLGAGGLLGGL